tara:strand:+ start:25 stop:582 length:558 start_codon:yes stop_codon:yes gene_type:complete
MTQYAYPDVDTTVGNWTASTGSDRYAMVDDAHGTAVAVADNTHITVADGGGGAEAIILELSAVTDPSASNLHKVNVLWSDDSGSSAVTLNVNLKDTDGSDVKNQNFSYTDESDEMDGSPSVSTMTLSTSEANSIASYAELILTLTATDGMGMGTNTTVFQAYFECPDAPASGATATPAAFLLFVD